MALTKYFRLNSKLSTENSVGPSITTCSADVDTPNKIIFSQEKVFQNPVILQVVLKHLLQVKCNKSNGKEEWTLSIQNAKRLRLVCRSWLREINILFRKSRQPMIFVTNNDCLHRFLASIAKEKENWVPPLSLSLSLDTFSIKCISMPRTISRMEIKTRLSLATLVLQRSDILEEMRVLKLNIITKKDLLDKEDLAILSSVLEQCSLSLEELELGINESIFLENGNLQVALNFPRMTNLKKMKIQGKIWRIDKKNNIQRNLGARLPKLEELEVKQISANIFLKEWCHNSVYWNVKSLTLILLTDLEDAPPPHGVLFSVEDMQKVIRSFPQVVHLQLGLVNPPELEGLRYMFACMGQLKSLQLNFMGELRSVEEIDGLLIGAGPEVVRRLKMDSTLWDRFLDGELNEPGIDTGSIRDLKLLESLVLQGNIVVHLGGDERQLPNIPSDLAFELGFMKLPSLQRLVLKGSFGVSEEMADKWCKQKEGREIKFKKKPGLRERYWRWIQIFLLVVLSLCCFYFLLTTESFIVQKNDAMWVKLIKTFAAVIIEFWFPKLVGRSILYLRGIRR